MNLSRSLRVPRPHRGWSLAEMLVVITVVGFLLAMAAPNLFSLLRASELSSQGEVMRNWLAQAQQQALATGSDVEVRFYNFHDVSSAQIVDEFRACQYFQYNDQGELAPLVEIYRLNDPVMFSRPLSSLLDPAKPGLSTGTVDAVTYFGTGLETDRVAYRSFRFRPDGSTDLPKNEQWYLTMVADEGASATPRNFFCIQIDPYNGSVREYRP
ncbi:MAG: Verru_Chthon cassette protein D [Verrucomicrobia bacterium]|nr:Verru_Chthon cassette protein D [Verrucomicrobiota bacterium]